MRVLVTGHQGYIGTVLAPMLRAAGHDVLGLDAGYYTDCVLGPEPEPVETLPVDTRDVTPEHCGGVDAVVHLAALCNDPLGNLNPGLTYDVNFRSTVRLARAAKAAGARRFLFSSSCSLYGAGQGDGLLDESAGFAPVTPYGESKIMAEQGLAELDDDSFGVVSLRNATAYGFSPRLRGDIVVNDLTAAALFTGRVHLRSDGSAWRPLVHIEDICGAVLALLEADHDQVHGKAYNIGSSTENYRIRQVADLVAEVVPGSVVTFEAGAGTDTRDYRVSCDLIQSEVPKFQPQWTVRQGIEQLVEAYQRYQLDFDTFNGENHQRLKRISALRQRGVLDEQLRWTSS